MGNKVTVIKGEETLVFEDTLGHQIGNGAVQVLKMDGDQRIINNFDDVIVELDDESKAKFAFDVAQAEARALASVAAQDEEYDDSGSVDGDGEQEEEESSEDESESSEPVKH